MTKEKSLYTPPYVLGRAQGLFEGLALRVAGLRNQYMNVQGVPETLIEELVRLETTLSEAAWFMQAAYLEGNHND